MRASLFGLAVVLAGCYTIPSMPPTLFAPTRPLVERGAKASPADVEVYAAGPPQREYHELGVFTAPGPLTRALVTMKAQGAELGCDAIVLGGANNLVSSQWPASTHPTRYPETVTRERLQGTCIAYGKAPPPAPPLAPIPCPLEP